MYKLLVLCCLVSCSSVNKYNPYNYSALNIILNIPGQVEQMEREEIERENCVKEKRCSQYYWDSSSRVWLTHRYTEDELADQKTAQEKDVTKCLEERKCESYQNKKLKETFVHRYDAKELEILEQNRLNAEAEESLKCLRAGQCVYISGKGIRFFTIDELDDLETRRSKDADQCIKSGKCIPYQIKNSQVTLYRRYSEENLMSLKTNESYEIKTAQQEEERLKKVRGFWWFD